MDQSKCIGKSRFFAVLIILAGITCPSVSYAVTASALDQGWYKDTGEHTATNLDTFTGLGGTAVFNSFFVFDLSTVSQSAGSAALHLTFPTGFAGANAAIETIAVFSVSTSIPILTAEHSPLLSNLPEGQTIFDDLAMGTQYSTITFDVPSFNPPEVLVIPLNADAVSNINLSLGGSFVVGLTMTTASSDNDAVRFSFDLSENTLVLNPVSGSVPEPLTTTLGLMGIGVLGLVMRRRTA